MDRRERGFTLLEIMVALGILAVLLAAGAWAMAARPAALAAATDDLDAALGSARAIAASSGNGATLLFTPNSDPSGRVYPGFSLRVYRGRPNAPASVFATTVMQLVSSASVRERTLGTPPFSIFIDSAGNASGMRKYPAFDPNGAPIFSVIAREPPCPPGGFLLTLTSPQDSALRTRSLPCAIALRAPVPAVSPTPNPPIVTPPALLFHWPGDAQQQFVATEWGYTHWFATSTGFACGDGVAAYPDVLPSPYSEPSNPSEAQLPPAPPSDTPFSYPNSHGGSTNDAPALLLLQPQGAGLCNASVRDDYGQSASASVVVMGWLSASYGGKTATHSSAALALPASALSKAGSTVTIAVSKSFDTAQLQPRIGFTGSTAGSCSADLAVSGSGDTTPSLPSATPATGSLILTLAMLPLATLACGGVIYNHYTDGNAPTDATSRAGEGIPFSASIGSPVSPLAAWPAGVVYAVSGESIGAGCRAIAYSDAALTKVDANDATYASLGASTDASGCYDGAVIASENNYAGTFSAANQGCNASVTIGSWSPLGMPVSALQMTGGSPSITRCALEISSSDETAANGGSRSVSVAVNACSGTGKIVTIGSGCEFSVISGPDPRDCVFGGYEGTYYQASVKQTPALGSLTVVNATSSDGGPTTYTYLWTRTAPGIAKITVVENETICTGEGQFAPYGSSTTTLTFD